MISKNFCNYCPRIHRLINMRDFIKNMRNFAPDIIRQRLYLQIVIVALFLIAMIFVSIWSGNTLTVITAIARFERTHTVSRLEAKASLLEYLSTQDASAKALFFEKMAVTQSYNKVFSNLLIMRTSKPDDEFVQILESTFQEADLKTAQIIVNRIKVLYWHPIIKELVSYAGKANLAGEKMVFLATLVMADKISMEEQQSALGEIKNAEKEFIIYEHSFSKRCSDLAHEIALFVNYLSIAILIFSVGFTSLITYLLAISLLQQATKHASDLEESRKQYFDLVEGTPDLIIRVDVKGNVVFVNHAALEIYGLTPEQSIGRRIFDFIHPEDQESTLSAFQDYLKSGETVITYENRQVGINGREHHMAWSIITERDEFHKVSGFACTARDVTERKEAEKALKKSQERLNLIIKGSNDAPWDWDMVNNQFYYSPQWWQQIGYTPNEFPTNSSLWEKLLLPEDLAHVRSVFGGALRGRSAKSYEVEFRLIHKNGHAVPILSRGFITRDTYGKPTRVTGTNMDLTERKQAEDEKRKIEAQLYQSQKMESIGTLAGGIAHEFNNILSIIIGNNELIMEELPKESPARENAEEIRVGSLRAKDVVKQLLTFTRQDNIKQSLVNTVSVVKESIKLIRSSITKNIDIHQSISDDVENVFGNATQINQILINLCTNAADAMKHRGGIIRIDLGNEMLDETCKGIHPTLLPGQYVRLKLSDTGSGMDKETFDRIFEPYFTTKDIGKGTGIGLAVVHGIVKKHHGSISVKSDLGKGTTFTILLPACQDESEPEQAEQLVLPTGDEQILFVDDEPILAELGKKLLQSLGYHVQEITDPIKALDIFKSDPNAFDLVITDMAMPGMTGDQLVSEILKIRPQIPAMLCTGYSEDVSVEKAYEIGFGAFVMKPVDRTELSVTVRKLLDKAKH